jgi:hypothetical protein
MHADEAATMAILSARVGLSIPPAIPYWRNSAALSMRFRVPSQSGEQGSAVESLPQDGYCNMTEARVASTQWEENMGRGILLWLLGVPIPIIILLALIWH